MYETETDKYNIKLIGKPTISYRRMRLNNQLKLAHLNTFKNANMKIPINRITLRTKNLSIGPTHHKIDLPYLDKNPTRILVAFVEHDNFVGNHIKNPFNFTHHNLEEIGIYSDEQSACYNKPLKMDQNFI